MYAKNVSRMRLLLYGRDHTRVCSPPYARTLPSIRANGGEHTRVRWAAVNKMDIGNGETYYRSLPMV